MRQRQRQASLPGFDLPDYQREAIDFLRRHEPPEGFFVGFSGGKDSIVTLDLCRMAGVRHQACYSRTGIDPPEVMRFLRREYPQVIWLSPRESFWSLIVKKNPPLRQQRWCCDDLKKAPSEAVPLRHRVMGIRAEESRMRASRPRVDDWKTGQTQYKPLFHWPEWAVWEHIATRGLAYPALYDERTSSGIDTCWTSPRKRKERKNADKIQKAPPRRKAARARQRGRGGV